MTISLYTRMNNSMNGNREKRAKADDDTGLIDLNPFQFEFYTLYYSMHSLISNNECYVNERNFFYI